MVGRAHFDKEAAVLDVNERPKTTTRTNVVTFATMDPTPEQRSPLCPQGCEEFRRRVLIVGHVFNAVT